MSTADFVRRFGNIYENSPWVAEGVAAAAGSTADPDQVARLMADCVDAAPRERQLDLIRAHPDLADRAQLANGLSADSRSEQASAGLAACTTEELRRFQALNAAYRKKFGFPFVMAVRGASRAEILAAFETRLENDRETEFKRALSEIHRIARLRLAALAAAERSR